MKAYSLETARQQRAEITELYLSRGDWEEAPSEIFDLPNLRILEISSHRLTTLPPAIGKLRQLERLHLASNRLTSLPAEIGHLSRLHLLDLQGNTLTHFPAAAGRLAALEVLLLAGNPLGKFPTEILALATLRELDLSGCRLRTLPPALGSLRRLQRLKLTGNTLRHLPAALFELRELIALDLSGNRLSGLFTLPAGCWPVLGQLNLAANRLTAGPEGLDACRLLQRLDLSNNRLQQCPAAVAALPWLTALDLHGNHLGQLPPALADCPQLEQLDLSGNPIDSLPALPPSLRRLNLRKCSLVEVPATVAAATGLRQLDLSYNRLQTLPSSLRALTRLRQLDLRVNTFDSLPEVLLRLDQLEELRGGPAGGARRILPFLRACRRDGTPGELRRPLFEAAGGNTRPLGALSTPLLLRALQFPLRSAALAARAVLTSERGRPRNDQPLGPGAGIALLGQTTFRTGELERRLPPLGLHFCPAIDATTTHLVIGLRPAAIPAGLDRQYVFLAEDELSRYLEEAEGRYLTTIAADNLDNLQKLLLSNRSGNVRLAVQLLRGGGVPAALHTELLIAWKTTTDRRLRLDLRALLERHIPEADKRVLSLPVGLTGDLSEEQLRQNIRKLTQGTAFEAEKIRRALER